MMVGEMVLKDVKSQHKQQTQKSNKKKNRCERCGKPDGPLNIPEERLQIHHKIPICYGGTNKQSNLVLLCKKCHDESHLKIAKERRVKIQKICEELMKSGKYRTAYIY